MSSVNPVQLPVSAFKVVLVTLTQFGATSHDAEQVNYDFSGLPIS